jgi:hypothetical protein
MEKEDTSIQPSQKAKFQTALDHIDIPTIRSFFSVFHKKFEENSFFDDTTPLSALIQQFDKTEDEMDAFKLGLVIYDYLYDWKNLIHIEKNFFSSSRTLHVNLQDLLFKDKTMTPKRISFLMLVNFICKNDNNTLYGSFLKKMADQKHRVNNEEENIRFLNQCFRGYVERNKNKIEAIQIFIKFFTESMLPKFSEPILSKGNYTTDQLLYNDETSKRARINIAIQQLYLKNIDVEGIMQLLATSMTDLKKLGEHLKSFLSSGNKERNTVLKLLIPIIADMLRTGIGLSATDNLESIFLSYLNPSEKLHYLLPVYQDAQKYDKANQLCLEISRDKNNNDQTKDQARVEIAKMHLEGTAPGSSSDTNHRRIISLEFLFDNKLEEAISKLEEFKKEIERDPNQISLSFDYYSGKLHLPHSLIEWLNGLSLRLVESQLQLNEKLNIQISQTAISTMTTISTSIETKKLAIISGDVEKDFAELIQRSDSKSEAEQFITFIFKHYIANLEFDKIVHFGKLIFKTEETKKCFASYFLKEFLIWHSNIHETKIKICFSTIDELLNNFIDSLPEEDILNFLIPEYTACENFDAAFDICKAMSENKITNPEDIQKAKSVIGNMYYNKSIAPPQSLQHHPNGHMIAALEWFIDNVDATSKQLVDYIKTALQSSDEKIAPRNTQPEKLVLNKTVMETINLIFKYYGKSSSPGILNYFSDLRATLKQNVTISSQNISASFHQTASPSLPPPSNPPLAYPSASNT